MNPSTLALTLTALVIEALLSYPAAIYAAIGHPVGWIGALIARLEKLLNLPEFSPHKRKFLGALTLLIALAVSGGLAATLTALLSRQWFGVILLAVLCSSLFAQRSLDDHVRAVARALSSQGLEAGRITVAKIVGRDVSALDEAGVSRAAIESLAENFSDGVVAPVFWTAALGLVGGALYKTANTADSMIGHKSERYLDFGWAAARFDDLVNLPASRLTALYLLAASFLTPGADFRAGLRAVVRDASKHRSPNAGFPEAALAGALGFKLGGPRVYGGVLVDDFYMGDGRADLKADDIWRALKLYRGACVVQALVLAGLCLALTL